MSVVVSSLRLSSFTAACLFPRMRFETYPSICSQGTWLCTTRSSVSRRSSTSFPRMRHLLRRRYLAIYGGRAVEWQLCLSIMCSHSIGMKHLAQAKANKQSSSPQPTTGCSSRSGPALAFLPYQPGTVFLRPSGAIAFAAFPPSAAMYCASLSAMGRASGR